MDNNIGYEMARSIFSNFKRGFINYFIGQLFHALFLQKLVQKN